MGREKESGNDGKRRKEEAGKKEEKNGHRMEGTAKS